jgi:hypothetical protein
MLLKIVSLCIIGMFTVLGSSGSPAQSLQPVQPSREYADLLWSDLVVRGKVEAVIDEDIPAELLVPDWTYGGMFKIAVIDFALDEVLLGSASGSTMTFVVEMSNSNTRADYKPGDEIVVGLIFKPDFREGTYFVRSDEARFVLEDGAWVRQGHSPERQALRIDELRTIVEPAKLDSAIKSADQVVSGVVTSVEERFVDGPNGGVARVLDVTLRSQEFYKGRSTSGDVIFQMFSGGTYWPAWAQPWPGRPETGTSYCVLLQEIDGKLYSAGGVNGFFRVKNGRLVRNGVELPVTLSHVRVMAEE